MATSDVSLNNFDGVNMTVTITLTREYFIRRWIAIHLIMLAARILDCGIEIVNA